jgi:hypothetical protein
VIANQRASNTHQYACDDAAGWSGELTSKPWRPRKPVEQKASGEADYENYNKRYDGVWGAHVRRLECGLDKFTQTLGRFSSSVTGTVRLYGREVDQYVVKIGDPKI